MCVLLITRLLREMEMLARKPVNHTSCVAVVTPTDRPMSVRNRCLIELFCGVICGVTLPFWHFCWCRGFCHRTGSDLLLFVVILLNYYICLCTTFLWPLRFGWLLVLSLYKEDYIQFFKICFLLIARLLRKWDGWALINRFNHTSWVVVVSPTDRPKSVRNRCVIEVFGGVIVLSHWFLGFSAGVGFFCHRNESDLFLFLFRFMPIF